MEGGESGAEGCLPSGRVGGKGVPVDVSHLVNVVQGENDLCKIEPRHALAEDVVVHLQEVKEVPAGVEVHNEVHVQVVAKSIVQC